MFAVQTHPQVYAEGPEHSLNSVQTGALATLSVMPRGTNDSNAVTSTDSHGADAPNPVWFKPVMFGFMLLGLVWILVFYISAGNLPVAALKEWNILVGFGIAFIGFLMTTRWR